MLREEDHIARFMSSLPFFNGLAEADLNSFLDIASIRDYSKGKPLFHQGDRADRLFAVLSGWVKLFRHTAEGDEAVTALFTRGDVFGEAAVFDGGLYPFSAQAAEEARLIEIPASLVKERAKANPEIVTRVMNAMTREMYKLQMENEHMVVMSAPQRVGCLLLQLSSGMTGKGGTLTFPYDKALAAHRLGMKPETFSRALSQLKVAGVTSKGTEIHIESFQCLSGYVCGHCSAEREDCCGALRKFCNGAACSGKRTRTAG